MPALAVCFLLTLAFAGPGNAETPAYKEVIARGAFVDALPLAKAALAGVDRGDRRWLEIALDVAQMQIGTGRYTAAERMLSAIRDALRATTAPTVAATEAYLRGLLYLELERLEESAQAFGEALSARVALFGSDHPSVAKTLADFGLLLSFQRDYEASERALKQALDILARFPGDTTLPVSETLSNMAAMEESRGNAERAQELATRALAIQEASAAPAHPRTANTLFNLGRAKAALGDPDAAIAALERSREIDRAGRGENHPYLAIASDDLANLYQRKGDRKAVQAARETSYRVNRAHFGPDHDYTLDSQTELANAYKQAGRYGKAVPLLRDLVPRLRAARGDTSDEALVAQNNLGETLKLAADLPGAEAAFRELLTLVERRFGPDHEETATVLNNLGNILVARGRYAAAKPVLKRAIAMIERTLGRDHPMIGVALGNLGSAFLEQGLVEQSLPLLERALAVIEPNLGEDSLPTAKALSNFALAELLSGSYEDSARKFRRVIDIVEKTLGPRHPQLTNPLNNLALALEHLGRGAEARAPLTRAIEIAEASLGPNHIRTAELHHVMAKLLGGLGEYDEGRPYLDRVTKTLTAGLGPDHPRLADVFLTIALFDSQQGDRARALARLRQIRGIFEKRAELAIGSPSPDASAELRKARKGFLFHLTALGRADPIPAADIAEAFEVAQLTQLGAAAKAVTRMAARFAAGDSRLAQRVRARQDAADRWARADEALTEALGRPQEKRDPAAEETWRTERDAAAEQVSELDAALAREFPRYRQLIGVRPMPLAIARTLLGPDEALIAFMTIDEGTAMIAVRRDAAQLHPIDIGAVELSTAVDRLRRGLDPTEINDVSALHEFDAETAHALYVKLFAPAEGLLEGARHVFVVPDGALTRLPAGVLLTEPPNAETFEFSAYRDMPWLARRFALSVLPSVSALRSVRGSGGRTASRVAMLGVGDPLLKDHPAVSGHGATRAGSAADWLSNARIRGATVPGLFRSNGLADVRAVRSLPSLPDSRNELEALRAAVGAEGSRLLLRENATESKLRARTDLSDYGILAFATHGLVAGELAGLTEPALVMTPPDEATAGDDGLLTASEISTLSLNADWVVLSACNTAGGGGDGEGLSGLAKAFFYAGSRALFVSHWPVASDAAVRLTTTMFRAQADAPEIGKAEAHRRAILAVMSDSDKPIYAHPLFWAPFVVVGDGGTYRPD